MIEMLRGIKFNRRQLLLFLFILIASAILAAPLWIENIYLEYNTWSRTRSLASKYESEVIGVYQKRDVNYGGVRYIEFYGLLKNDNQEYTIFVATYSSDDLVNPYKLLLGSDPFEFRMIQKRVLCDKSNCLKLMEELSKDDFFHLSQLSFDKSDTDSDDSAVMNINTFALESVEGKGYLFSSDRIEQVESSVVSYSHKILVTDLDYKIISANSYSTPIAVSADNLVTIKGSEVEIENLFDPSQTRSVALGGEIDSTIPFLFDSNLIINVDGERVVAVAPENDSPLELVSTSKKGDLHVEVLDSRWLLVFVDERIEVYDSDLLMIGILSYRDLFNFDISTGDLIIQRRPDQKSIYIGGFGDGKSYVFDETNITSLGSTKE